MNLASKLGEDMAKAEQILLTEAAWSRLGAKKRAFVARRARISGLAFSYYEHKRQHAAKSKPQGSSKRVR